MAMAAYHKIIGSEEHDKQLRALRATSPGGGGGHMAELPTRTHGNGRRLDLQDEWSNLAGPFRSAEDAKRAILKERVVWHGNNGGEWASNNHESGGCKAYYHCNGHVGCQVQLRVREDKGADESSFFIQATQGMEHALTPKSHRRLNSPLSIMTEKCVERMHSEGKTPKRCKEKLQELLLNAKVPKDPRGGFPGKLQATTTSTTVKCTRPDICRCPGVQMSRSRCLTGVMHMSECPCPFQMSMSMSIILCPMSITLCNRHGEEPSCIPAPLCKRAPQHPTGEHGVQSRS